VRTQQGRDDGGAVVELDAGGECRLQQQRVELAAHDGAAVDAGPVSGADDGPRPGQHHPVEWQRARDDAVNA
jgi:hypothetical protein